jgi:hypothetical protein
MATAIPISTCDAPRSVGFSPTRHRARKRASLESLDSGAQDVRAAATGASQDGAGVGGLRFELMANAVVTESAISKKLSLQAKRQV